MNSSPLLSSIPGVLYGFGNCSEPTPASFESIWAPSQPIWRQTHGVTVVEVKEARQACGETDALYTRGVLPIGVITADCVPILLARRDGCGVAAVHAGWRGTLARVLCRLWDRLSQEGENPGDWAAAIGPAIGPCCYEVSEDLAHAFAAQFSDFGSGLAVPRPRILDLPAINAQELKAIGVKDVDLIRACTRCMMGADGPVFHSYRREGGGTRQYSLIRGITF